jgi:hypothetical protein
MRILLSSWQALVAALLTVSAAIESIPQMSYTGIGTTLVALRTRDSVIVATDSREVQIDPSGRIVRTRDDKCKMFEQDRVLFALAGIAQSTADFDAMMLARRVIKPGRSLQDMASDFQRTAQPAIETEVRRWKSPPGERAEGVPGLHYLFAKAEGGVSALVWAESLVSGVQQD